MCYGVFVFGRYFLLRGRKEVAFLRWDQVKFCTATENGKLVEYVEVVQHFDKSRQLDLNNTTASSTTDLPPRMYPNNNDPLCPVKWLKFFRSINNPDQTSMFCKLYNQKQMKLWRKQKKPYLYNPNLVLGKHNIEGTTKKFAEVMGFDHWEKCTNHSNRKLGISMAVCNTKTGILSAARHKDANTQKNILKKAQTQYKPTPWLSLVNMYHRLRIHRNN